MTGWCDAAQHKVDFLFLVEVDYYFFYNSTYQLCFIHLIPQLLANDYICFINWWMLYDNFDLFIVTFNPMECRWNKLQSVQKLVLLLTAKKRWHWTPSINVPLQRTLPYQWFFKNLFMWIVHYMSPELLLDKQ